MPSFHHLVDQHFATRSENIDILRPVGNLFFFQTLLALQLSRFKRQLHYAQLNKFTQSICNITRTKRES